MTEKLTNHVSSTFDDELYLFVRAAASKDGVDVSSFIRAVMADLRDKKLDEYKLWHSVFESQIDNI